jgi:hypothetical protein
MPSTLFGSRKPSREIELFVDAKQRALSLIDTSPLGDPHTPPRFLEACVEGGALAAGTAIPAIPSLKKAWGKGDARKANAVTEVFTMAVTSRVLFSLGLQQETRHRELVGRNVAALFQDGSPTAVASFVALDAQFNRECELLQSQPGVPQVEGPILRLRLLAAARLRPNTRLDALSLPVDSLRDLVKQEAAEGLAFTDAVHWTELEMIHILLRRGWNHALTLLGAPERPVSR